MAEWLWVAESILITFAAKQNIMPSKKIKGSLSEIVDKMNKVYNGRVGTGFNLGLDRRVVPVMKDGTVTAWKMQRLENDTWVDLDERTFETMKALIGYYNEDVK